MTDYVLIRSERRSLAVQIKEGKVIVRAPKGKPLDEIESFLARHQRWIRNRLARQEARRKEKESYPPLTPEDLRALVERAKRVIPERVAYYAPKVGVSYNKVTIRILRSLWGSCTSQGNLSFNALLLLAPPSVLDSIVVHELCHRKQMNHSPRFYREVLRVYPRYYDDHRWLKEHGNVLLSLVKNH